MDSTLFRREVDERLRLCQIDEPDADDLYALIDRERNYLRKYISGEFLAESLADVHGLIFISTLRHLTNGAFDAGIWYDGQLIGIVSLHTINPAELQSDIGYFLARDFQRKGIMTTCVREVVECAFGDYGLKELRIYCPVDNLRSRAIPERLGFKFERIFPDIETIDGKSADEVVYLMRSEWWQS